MICLIKTSNYMTTWYYYDLIIKAFEASFAEKVVVFENRNELKKIRLNKKKDIIIVGTDADSFYFIIKGFKNIVSWHQGIMPEERKMSGHSWLNVRLHTFIEAFSLKREKLSLFVSNTQKEYLLKKYRICKLESNSFIMPCFNENDIILDSFTKTTKEIVFCYTGGFGKWQCIDETLDLYKTMEGSLSNTKLVFLTNNPLKAEELIRNKGIQKYVCKYVEQDSIHLYLKEANFGFVLRENSPVNNCATPTKLSTYLANGVIPVFTKYITDFSLLMKNYKYKIELDSLDPVDNQIKITEFIESTLTPSYQGEMLEEYKEIFDCYYNSKKYIDSLSLKIVGLFKNVQQ